MGFQSHHQWFSVKLSSTTWVACIFLLFLLFLHRLIGYSNQVWEWQAFDSSEQLLAMMHRILDCSIQYPRTLKISEQEGRYDDHLNADKIWSIVMLFYYRYQDIYYTSLDEKLQRSLFNLTIVVLSAFS
jgi:hypothetical protein